MIPESPYDEAANQEPKSWTASKNKMRREGWLAHRQSKEVKDLVSLLNEALIGIVQYGYGNRTPFHTGFIPDAQAAIELFQDSLEI